MLLIYNSRNIINCWKGKLAKQWKWIIFFSVCNWQESKNYEMVKKDDGLKLVPEFPIQDLWLIHIKISVYK